MDEKAMFITHGYCRETFSPNIVPTDIISIIALFLMMEKITIKPYTGQYTEKYKNFNLFTIPFLKGLIISKMNISKLSYD